MSNEEYITCPYDVAHRIAQGRLQHHLVKCQKNKPTLWICPFNATHRYPDHLKQQHVNTCPSKPYDEPRPQAIAATEGTIGAKTTPKPILQREYLKENDPENEYWDDD